MKGREEELGKIPFYSPSSLLILKVVNKSFVLNKSEGLVLLKSE